MPNLLVVAGEASTDLYASHVIRHVRALCPDLHVAGIGSARCRGEGMEVLAEAGDLAVVGFTEVLGALGNIRGAFQRCLDWVDLVRADAALLLDYAGFNLRMAKKLKERGIPVIYYISPKLWAWRAGRVRQVRACVDRMLVIFPFEVAFYQAHGVDAEFVGNPSVDDVAEAPTRPASRDALGLGAQSPVVALLPGSRRAEVRRHLLPMLDGAIIASRLVRDVEFVIPQATTVPWEWLAEGLRYATGLGLRVKVVPSSHAVLAAADAAVIASGTATLEAALLGTPMVVVYRVGWLTGLLARILVRLAHVSLVNVLSQRGVVTELLQGRAKPGLIARELVRVLDRDVARDMREEFQHLRGLLGGTGASRRVAEVIRDVVDARGRRPSP